MTTIDRANLKRGDRVRLSRTGTVTSDPLPDSYSKRVSIRLDSGRTITPSITETDTIELLERALPEEPPAGSVVMFRPVNERHLTQTTVYQHFSDYWQSTRIGGKKDRYAWAEVLKNHEGERLEVLVTTP